MNDKMALWQSILIGLFYCNIIAAQPFFHEQEFFGGEQGITGTPTSLAEDRYGFIWIGTSDGLFRFDGNHAQEVVVFDEQKGQEKYIYSLFYDDASKKLYICTRAAGLLTYDLATETVDAIDPLDYYNREQVYSKQSHFAIKDRQGDLWLDLQVLGAVRFPANGKPPQHFTVDSIAITPTEPSSQEFLTFSNVVAYLVQDLFQDSIIWGGTRRGLMRINKIKGTARQINYQHPIFEIQDESSPMRHIFQHTNGKLYISTWNGGMLEYDPLTNHFEQFFVAERGFDKAVYSNQIHKVFARSANTLWVSRTGEAEELFIFDITTRKMTKVCADCGVDFIDSKGNIWDFAPNGLRLYHQERNLIERHYFPPEWKIGRTRKVVQRKNPDQLLVKAKMKGGILQLTRSTGRWKLLPFPIDQQTITDGYLLEEVTAGIITNDNDQLYILRTGDSHFQPLFTLPDQGSNTRSIVGPDESIYITGVRGDFFWIKPDLTKAIRFSPQEINEPFPDFLSNAKFGDIDQFGRIWLFSAHGYSIFSPSLNSFQHFPYRDDPDIYFANYRDFRMDSTGKMWCTDESAIGWIDPANPALGIQQRYDYQSGHELSALYYIGTGSGDSLCFLAQQGMIRLDTKSGSMYPLGFWGLSLDKLSDQSLAISTNKGIGLFLPDTIQMSSHVPQPYLHSFRVANRKHPLVGSPFRPEAVTLEPTENNFSIGFSALDFFLPGKAQLAYRMEGIDQDWILADPNVFSISYSGLPGGTYTFHLKAKDVVGNWSNPLSFSIRIKTPWYNTTLAWITYFLLCSAIIGSFIWFWFKRRELRQKLQHEQHEAQRAKEVALFKSRFFTNITHEFRTPLTVILGLAERLKKQASNPVEADMLLRNGQNLLDLVNQLLDLARLDASMLQLAYIQADIILFLKVHTENFRSLALSRNQSLAFSTSLDSFLMDFDPTQVRQILYNLISNALKFTPDYGTIIVRVEVANDSSLQLQVEDTGPGIPENLRQTIFERFYQIEQADYAQHRGTGIGLALTKELVNLMGGTIHVQNKRSSGCLFTVNLPVHREAEIKDWQNQLKGIDQPLTKADHPAVKDFYESLPVLLIVEDNADLSHYLSTLLEKQYYLLLARNGVEGVDKAKEFMPDIIISDVMMPKMDGLEMCRILQSDERTSHIPVIFLTAKSTEEDKIQGLDQGAYSYLSKPFKEEELFLQLRNALAFKVNTIKFLNRKNGAEEIPATARKEEAFLQKVAKIIESELDNEDFDVIRLARSLQMSRAQLYRKVNALTGTSVALYIRQIRLQNARKLLSTTTLSISEIAYQVGFKDPNYFSKVFSETYGHPPSETRK
jgi:signal transduction histidine kinase/DNA-binding response OmpR family regulator